jgi:prevent-host-death family protein
MKTMGAAKAKAQFLALLDHVENKRESVLVTRNGRPVAQLVPVAMETRDPIFGFYRGRLRIVGDITAPLFSDKENEEFLNRTAAQLSQSAKAT